MNKEKINKSYNILKDNLSVILLVPTVLGGIWQLLELSSMSASFIRFFSFTQLIADGLLILFVLTIFFISYRIVGSSFSAKTFKFDPKNPPPLSYGVSLTLLIVITYVFLFPSLKSAYHKKNITIPEIAIMIPALTMLIGGAILGIISILENLISRKSNTIKSSLANKWIKGILDIFFKLFIFFLWINKIYIHRFKPSPFKFSTTFIISR